jgi:hypothetical protein
MTFQKLDLFTSSGGGKTPTQLGPLERANLKSLDNPVRFTQLFHITSAFFTILNNLSSYLKISNTVS